jgi:hypothetical protein
MPQLQPLKLSVFSLCYIIKTVSYLTANTFPLNYKAWTLNDIWAPSFFSVKMINKIGHLRIT